MAVSQQLGLNADWFEVLKEERNTGLYSTEASCSYEDGVGNIIHFLKDRKPCAIEFKSENGIKILTDCQIRQLVNEQVTITLRGKELVLSIDDIIKVCEQGRCIY